MTNKLLEVNKSRLTQKSFEYGSIGKVRKSGREPERGSHGCLFDKASLTPRRGRQSSSGGTVESTARD